MNQRATPIEPVFHPFAYEITIDGFCGGGGWSTGFELAIGRPVDVGINHDKAAIALHKKNHPYTRHYQTNIFDVDPVEACQGRPVAWAHFSPDCKHFSRAKGAKPVSKQIRSLAWVVLKWASAVHPRIISMENVPEFMTWGPLVAVRGPGGRVMRRDGMEAEPGARTPYEEQLLTPDRRRAGATFRVFVKCLRSMGYAVEWNELTACDYGAPTSRRRFFLLARRDGKPIVWPEPTHGDPRSDAVRSGKLLPWHTAAEIIDWNDPCPSIFERKKPLAENTLRRIARGIEKYIVNNPEPFIVQVNHGGENFRGQDVEHPLPTITAKHGFGVVAPVITKFQQNSIGQSPETPLDTVMPRATRFGVVASTLIQYHTEQSNGDHRGQAITSPLQTVDASNRYGFVSATLSPAEKRQACATFLSEYYSRDDATAAADAPMHTVTTKDRSGVVAATMIQFNSHCDGLSINTPIPTITAQGNHFAEVRAMLIKFYGCGTGQRVTAPLDTITAKDRFGLVEIHGEKYQIVDIGLRMLTPRELYDAQGFPHDYEIETDCYGNAYPKKEQVARCGNAVPPAFATALTRANWPEACQGVKVESMEELNNLINLNEGLRQSV